jgi:hypothetical protein
VDINERGLGISVRLCAQGPGVGLATEGKAPTIDFVVNGKFNLFQELAKDRNGTDMLDTLNTKWKR